MVPGVFACWMLMHYSINVLGNLSALLESSVLLQIIEISTQITLVFGCYQLYQGWVDRPNFQLVVTWNLTAPLDCLMLQIHQLEIIDNFVTVLVFINLVLTEFNICLSELWNLKRRLNCAFACYITFMKMIEALFYGSSLSLFLFQSKKGKFEVIRDELAGSTNYQVPSSSNRKLCLYDFQLEYSH